MNTYNNSNMNQNVNVRNNFTHLSLGERKRIKQEYYSGTSIRTIAKILYRAPSTISREIRRNGTLNQPSAAAQRQNTKPYRYSSNKANVLYQKRRLKSNFRNKYPTFIEWLLKHHNYYLSFDKHIYLFRKYNPEIAFPSLKTVYNWFKSGLLKLISNLKVKTYRKKYCSTNKDDRKSIHIRDVNDYVTPGHYEIDTIYNSDKQGGVLTFNHRASMKLYARIIDDRKATTINKALRSIINEIGADNIISITSDNGSEFCYSLVIEKCYKLNWFYCDPFRSGQRGQNERLNRDIRKYYGKNCNFTSLDHKEFQSTINKINCEPRRKFSGLSAYEQEDIISSNLN